MLRIVEGNLQVESNLSLVARDRGKIVARRDGHNIWLNIGREYLVRRISYSSMSPLTPYENNATRYMGLGIGGSRQLILAVANAAPLVTHYPGTNVQTDIDPAAVQRLERPVRISGSSSTPPYLVSDLWLGQIQAPPVFPTATSVTYKRLISQIEISYGPYLTVPLSEIGLFTNAADPNVFNNTCVAYDTFDSLSKTNAFELEVSWTIRF